MIMKLFTIKDELSEFSVPFPALDEANAKRYFRQEVKNNKMMADNPQDFSIWYIGLFNTETGENNGLKLPILVERARVTNNGNTENKTVQNDTRSTDFNTNTDGE